MKAKRLSSAPIIILLVISLFSGCSRKAADGSQAGSTGTDDTNPDTAIGSLSYILNTVNIPSDYRGKLYNMVSAGDRLYFVSDNKIYTMDKAGESIQELSAYAPLEGYTLVFIGRNYNGSLMAVEQGSDSCLISWVEEDGTVSGVTDITAAVAEAETFVPMNCFSDISGNIYFLLNNGNKPESVMIIGPDGNFLYTGYPDIEGLVKHLVLSGSGKAYIATEEGAGLTYVRTDEGEHIFNQSTRTAEAYKVYELMSDGSIDEPLCEIPLDSRLYSGGSSYDLIYSDFYKLYGLNTSDGSSVVIFTWDSYSLSGPWMLSILDVGDYALFCVYHGEEYLLFEEGYEAPKTVIKLATYGFNYLLDWVISEFNRKSETHKVVKTDYSAFDNNGDGAGLMKLNAEIQAGNIPDVIDFTFISPKTYEDRGLLTDLYPLIDSDPEIKRSDLLSPYVKSYEKEGKLHLALMGFTLNGFIGKAETVGAGHSWTLEDMLAAQAAFPGAPGMGGLNRSEAVKNYLGCLYENYIDWQSGDCSFNSESFISILKYIKTLDEEVDMERLKTEHVLSGETPFTAITINSIGQLMLCKREFSDTEFTIKGYPTGSGNGILLINPYYALLGITEACKDKAGAWGFVRILFTAYVSEVIGAGLPASRLALDAALKKAMEENVWAYKRDGDELITIRLDPATQAEVNSYMELINSCDTFLSDDITVMEIIEEELEPFFSGSKTAEETAEIIQNRVQTYVYEQKR
jgi:ABC-type glycerol-3-phosphate transport system substrate-binding protein